jgi:hypothetical protein
MIARRLLPNARAWNVTVQKQLRQFVGAFDVLEVGARAFFDSVHTDLWPATTRQLDAWEAQFGLIRLGLSEADRRTRLEATWAAVGGQSPGYIQDTLQAAGFDVYVHEWWVPGTEPATGDFNLPMATPRNPLTYLQQTYPGLSVGVQCDALPPATGGYSNYPRVAQCGEPWAESGNQTDPPGYPLVNKVPDIVRSVPTEQAFWPFFLYIGGEVFGTLAQVDTIRRDEFETLCLKICPAHLWLAMLVEY